MTAESQLVEEEERPTGWERAFAAVIIVLLTGAFMNLFLTPEQQLDPSEGLPVMRYLWAAIYVVVLIMLRRYCKGSLGLLLQERAILLLTALAVVSAIWSDAPGTTLRRSVALAGTLVMALYFAWRFKFREQLQILVWGFAACAAFSFLFGVFHLGHSVDDLQGAWYGAYTQRNELGTVMVFGALTFLVWSRMPGKPERIGWSLAAGAFGLIVLSGSITSMLAFGALVCTIPMIWLIRRFERTGRFLLLLGVVLIGVGWWVGTSFDAVTEAMGRDSSLTGRTELWGASILFGLNHPVLGYGYNAFWMGLEGQSADVWQIVGWAAPSAHNGLLEIWLDLGLAGVAIVIYSFGSSLRRAFEMVRDTANWQYAWPLLFLVILFVMNLTESAFFEGNSIYWFLYMVTAMDLTLLEKQRRKKSRAQLTGANP